MPVQVLICDDQEAFRSAARQVVNATRGFEVVGEAKTGEESVLAAGLLHPDLVLMDVQLPGIDGLEASRQIRAAYPDVAVLLLSTYDPEDFAARIDGARNRIHPEGGLRPGQADGSLGSRLVGEVKMRG